MMISQGVRTYGFVIGLAVAAPGAQAASQASQHQNAAASAQKPAAPAMKGMGGMKDMHTMMSGPAMPPKMIAHMAQCRDMMSIMIEHMKHDDMKKGMAAPKQRGRSQTIA